MNMSLKRLDLIFFHSIFRIYQIQGLPLLVIGNPIVILLPSEFIRFVWPTALPFAIHGQAFH